jgi:hypothetical protein
MRRGKSGLQQEREKADGYNNNERRCMVTIILRGNV